MRTTLGSRPIFLSFLLLGILSLLLVDQLGASPIDSGRPEAEMTPGGSTQSIGNRKSPDPELQMPATTGIVFRVTIERVVATNNFDGPFGFDRADFFGRVRIDTQTQESPVISNDDDIAPAWEFASTVLMDDSIGDEVVTLSIGVWDADDFNNAQEADLTSTSDRSLNLTVDVDQCLTDGIAGTVTGSGVSGGCGQTLVSQGTLGQDTFNTARIEFRVEADRPPTAPGLNVLCLQDPLWPQPGNNVTVDALALSDNMSPKVVDRIDVFLQNTASPASSCTFNDECAASAIATGDSLFYGCRVQDGTDVVWTGWKRVQVGLPPQTQRAVPVIFTGPSPSRVDIVFVPDIDNFPNPADPGYLAQVRMAIREAYFGGQMISPSGIPDADRAYGERLFLSNQDRINFWIALDTGDIDGDTTRCFGINAPANWGTDYTFADSGAVLHMDEFRDCALPASRIFGSETFSFRTMIHETMHSPFGLADEYCCDSHYFQPSPLPNLYAGQSACMNDIQSLLEWDVVIGDPSRDTSACVNMGNGWWRSDSPMDDIMADRGEFNAADVRRVSYLFDRCAGASCRLLLNRSEPLYAAGSPADPVPEFDWSTTDKVVSLTTTFSSRTAMDVTAIDISYGHAPMPDGGPPMLQLEMLDVGDFTFRRTQVWHPLLRLGTVDPEIGLGHGPAEWLNGGQTTLHIPFSPQLASIRFTDLELGQVLATIDVRPVVLKFCAEHPEDESCQSVNEPPGVAFVPVIRGK